jgi:hypothetical protein
MINAINDQRTHDTQYRIIRSVIHILCFGCLFLTCLQVIGHGYSPADDALRHVAKVISGKPWSQILVIRPEMTMDSHPGWHTILSWYQTLSGCDINALLNFSVIFLFLVFTLPPVFYFRRPEAWVASLALSSIFFFLCILRLFFGRPYIFSMAMILLFCFTWNKIKEKDKPWLELIALFMVTVLATWIHGTWYLFTLPLLGLFLARQWRVLLLTSITMSLGVIFGALLTGSPLTFLHQMVFHALDSFGNHFFTRQLVTEFQPFSGEIPVFLLIGGLLLWRWARGEWNNRIVDNPVFYLAVIGWLMGFVAQRFWLDWAWPALAFWCALEIQTVLEYYTEKHSWRRLIFAGMFCLILLLSVSHDGNSRWSGTTAMWPKIEKVDEKPWFPEEGGILYNDSMGLFYNVFFHNPHGHWRYTLGFEPIWMTADDLIIYRNIQLTRQKNENYLPWVKKMTSKDRMMLIRQSKPQIKGLEWYEVKPTVWSGRLKQKEQQ